MIIVSQDKERIVNFDNLTQIYITHCKEDNTGYFIRTVDSLYEDLGEYAIEERAKEVLEEIVKQYEYTESIKRERAALRLYDNFIYRMPKE